MATETTTTADLDLDAEIECAGCGRECDPAALDGDGLCEDCAGHYQPCVDCGELVCDDDAASFSDDGAEWTCRACQEEVDDRAREAMERLLTQGRGREMLAALEAMLAAGVR